MNEGKGNTVLLTIIGIATLLIAVVGATFAYFTAVLTGAETGTTMTINSGTIGTVFEGGSAITSSDVWPREEHWGTKTFTVKGNSESDTNIYYNLGLVVETNTFSVDALKYTLAVEQISSSTNGTKAPEILTQKSIPKSGTENLGTGIFNGPTGGEVAHVYTLTVYFPETGVDQSGDMEKILYAHISVSAETSGQTTTAQP